MDVYDKITPEGTKDYLFKECHVRTSAENKLRRLYEQLSYDEVMTTSLEFYDVFSQGVGRLSQNELYTLTDSSGRLLAMRPDSTKPIARLFASRLQALPLPVKLFYRQPVFKRNIKYYKKSDEIMQMGVELVGIDSFKSDIETLILAIKSMRLLFGNDFVVEIGHVGVISAILDGIDTKLRQKIKQAIAKKNHPEFLQLVTGLENEQSLAQIPRLIGGVDILSVAQDLFPQAIKAISRIKEIYSVLKDNQLNTSVVFDLTWVSSYDYYTGIVFRAFSSGKEILSGGRYDTLYSDYNLNLPAIGFAINLDDTTNVLIQSLANDNLPLAVIHADSVFCSTDIINFYQQDGFECKVSLFDELDDSIKWAKQLGAKRLIIIKKDNTKKVLEL